MELKLQTVPVKNLLAATIIINTAPDEIIVAGKGFGILFTSELPDKLPLSAIDFVDDGTLKKGKLIKARRLMEMKHL